MSVPARGARPSTRPGPTWLAWAYRHPGWTAWGLVALAAIAAFARGLDGGLLMSWDDDRFIAGFEPIREVSVENLVAIWAEPHYQAYHPLHLMAYWLDVPWAGPDPRVVRAVNLVLWLVSIGAVLGAVRALGLGWAGATLATALWALHPVQVEAVGWPTGRKEIVAALLVALALRAHARSHAPFDRASWLARLFYLLGALTKTTVLPLPAVMLLHDRLMRDEPWRRAFVRQLPALALGLALAVVVVVIWRVNEMIRPEPAGGGLAARVALVLATLTHHLSHAVWPARLSPVYPLPDDVADLGPWRIAGGLAGMLVAAVWAYRRRARPVLFGLLAFVLLALPVLNVIPMYWLWTDRYLSLPLLGLAFAAGGLLDRIETSASALRSVARVGAALAAVALVVRTAIHVEVYTSDDRLWGHAVSVYPNAVNAWLKRGESLRDAGRIEEAIAAYERAITLAPGMRIAHAALFYATALADERRAETPARPDVLDVSWCVRGPTAWKDHVGARMRGELDRSPAWLATRCYHGHLTRPQVLVRLASALVAADYRRAASLALGLWLALEPRPPERLEEMAVEALGEGRPWLARVFLERLGRPPLHPTLRGWLAAQGPGHASGAPNHRDGSER
ncbi:MAG: tetratricopeptide repeat protein [Myxococcota bacterium]|nr:tetratricopeptide repeat protein [Myxococcota bacterium]MDW8362696.1 tetratricopeptide repeat protein [Myxococcales bacterium]